MDLTRYVEDIKSQLTATAELGGEDARTLAEQMVPHLDGMVRLVLLETLSTAADEITTELAPGSVTVRLRGRDPEFDVVSPAVDVTSGDVAGTATTPPRPTEPEPPVDADDVEIARITLRLPEHLKTQVERAATTDRLSVNAWLVRAVADAVETRRPDPRATHGNPVIGQRLTGWAR